MILVPLFDLKFLTEFAAGRNFKSAALSLAETQGGAQHRDLAREFDLDSLPGLQVPQRIRQGAKIRCLGATQNQEPVASLEPCLLGAGPWLHAAHPHTFTLVGHVGHDAGRDPARRARRPPGWWLRCAYATQQSH